MNTDKTEVRPPGAGWIHAALPARPARVLDAGCGRGELAAELIGRGHHVTVVDASAEAVAAARAAGVPAVPADITTYEDEPFEVIVLSLSLHHMHPLEAALDRVAALLAPGGRLVVDEFAWDWADEAAAAWFYDTGALLTAAGPAGLPYAPGIAPIDRWRAAHADHTGGDAMLAALRERFDVRTVRRGPYLARYLSGKLPPGAVAGEVAAALWRIERERLALGALPATGLQLLAGQM
ncbi:class I SAM-dependent methyltransferase [Nonomuraea rhizosphaerae]|uniref:class I SAM-dependent methyltransferase n=1 Tax=Nonomuraea rhizosphaerae TaxID=2665663 RepID=UPI001FEAF731|nr:methyltransferase domain-containing protein [Nonomuraea rhizosphaerae]